MTCAEEQMLLASLGNGFSLLKLMLANQNVVLSHLVILSRLTCVAIHNLTPLEVFVGGRLDGNTGVRRCEFAKSRSMGDSKDDEVERMMGPWDVNGKVNAVKTSSI